PSPSAARVRLLFWPVFFVLLAVIARDRPARRGVNRGGWAPAGVALPERVRIIVARKGAGAHRARHVEIARVRAVRHGRPVCATDPRRLYQHWSLPEGLKDTAGFSIPRQHVSALGHDRVADRERLRLRRLLPWLLWHWTLLDAKQGLAVGAVQEIHPARAADFGEALARLPIDHCVKEHHRTRGIIVPDVVMHLLEMPGVGPG